MKKDRVGEVSLSKEGYEILIIASEHNSDCTIQFNDSRKTILNNVRHSNIKKGEVKNPFHPSVYGVGYVGIGSYKKSFNGKVTKAYEKWHGMLGRCYDKYFQIKNPSYKGCSVDESWKDFQVFAEWFEKNYVEGWQLDKDILKKNNKIYSPEVCCFVPSVINKIFIRGKNKRGLYPIGVSKSSSGKFLTQISIKSKQTPMGLSDTPEEAFNVYKSHKEEQIKKLAKQYSHKLPERIYQVLINYKIEITD